MREAYLNGWGDYGGNSEMRCKSSGGVEAWSIQSMWWLVGLVKVFQVMAYGGGRRQWSGGGDDGDSGDDVTWYVINGDAIAEI